MDERRLQEQIDVINHKLDIILEEIALQQRRRREMDDLKEDLMRVGKDVYQTAVVELEDVHDYLKTGDIMYLGKKLLRNVNTMTAMFEQLESLRDFLQDVSPLARDSFIDIMNKLDEFDRKGYFAFFKELGKVADKVVGSFTTDDVKALGDNIVTILNTVKSMTQPDMLHAVNNAVNVYKKLDMEVTEDVSLLSLLKELNTPEARKGMTFAIRFLKSISATNGTHSPHSQGEHHGNS
jgi:uncharacterized protein YjgD (DUF1641 family)